MDETIFCKERYRELRARIRVFIRDIDKASRTNTFHEVNILQFVAWLSYKGISSPKREDILAYREWLQTEHAAIRPNSVKVWSYRKNSEGRPYEITCKPATVSAYLHSLRKFFAWTEKKGIYPDIAKDVRSPQVEDTFGRDALTAADIRKIEEKIKEKKEGETPSERIRRKRLLAVFSLTVNAGLRTVEIARLKVKDIEKRENMILLYVWGKGHDAPDQVMPLSEAVYADVRSYLDVRQEYTPESPLFASESNRNASKHLTSAAISRMLKNALVAAGYDSERITAHSLRHTTGTKVMELSESIYDTREYMRHKNAETTTRYIHRQQEISQDLYEAFHGGDLKEQALALIPYLSQDQLKDLLQRYKPSSF